MFRKDITFLWRCGTHLIDKLLFESCGQRDLLLLSQHFPLHSIQHDEAVTAKIRQGYYSI